MELRKGDMVIIANALECSREYVKKVLRGERSSNTRLAKKILQARQILITGNRQLSKQIQHAA